MRALAFDEVGGVSGGYWAYDDYGDGYWINPKRAASPTSGETAAPGPAGASPTTSSGGGMPDNFGAMCGIAAGIAGVAAGLGALGICGVATAVAGVATGVCGVAGTVTAGMTVAAVNAAVCQAPANNVNNDDDGEDGDDGDGDGDGD